jgi:WD40 repeat protein
MTMLDQPLAALLGAHLDPVQTLRMSPDGQWLISGDTERHLRLWLKGELVHEISLRSDVPKFMTSERIRQVAVSPDSQKAYVACGDAIHAVDLETGKVEWRARTHRYLGFLVLMALGVDVAEDGRVAISFENGQFGTRDPLGRRLRVWKDNAGPRWLSFTSDGSGIVGSDGFVVARWDSDSGEMVARLRMDEHVYGFAAAKRQGVFAVRTLHHIVVMSDSCFSEPIFSVPAAEGLPLLAFSPTDATLAVADRHLIRVFSPSGQPESTFEVAEAVVLSLAFTSDGGGVMVGLSDGRILQFDLPK